MNKAHLLKTAGKLSQVNEKYAKEFSEKRDKLVSLMNTKMEERPDILDMVGKNNIEMMRDNHSNHARFLESIFFQHSPEILVDTVIWVFRAYRARNFASTYWAAQLNVWLEVYKTELSKECYNEIQPYYNWMLTNIPSFNKLAEENAEASASAH